MDIFCRNVPNHSTQRELARYFQGPLNDCGVRDYHVEKLRDKGMAIITVLDPHAGTVFLNRYGLPQYAHPHARALLRLSYAGKFLRLEKSRNEPTDFALQALAYEASQRTKDLLVNAAAQQGNKNKNATKFEVTTMQCGSWDYARDARLRSDSKLTFISHFTDNRPGHVHFGLKEAILILGSDEADQLRIDFPYSDCIDIVLGTYDEPSLTFALKIPPKMYEVNMLATVILALTISPSYARNLSPKKVRIPSIGAFHSKMAGTCFVYRVDLRDSRFLSNIRTILQKNAKMPNVLSQKTVVEYPKEPLDDSFLRLSHELTDMNRFGRKPFKLRYQVERLARNGFLPPLKVLALLGKVSEIYSSYGLDPTLYALKRLSRHVPYPGPGVEASELSTGTLEEILEGFAECYDALAPENSFELVRRHTHINLIHKVVVTPTGIRLEGPEPEPTNRVLRDPTNNTDNFIRVVFQDEDGSQVRYDPRTDLTRIYHQRFRGVLDSNILICGRGFSFLGFSHSSLRSQACWFMAPFVNKKGGLSFSEHLLKSLGDFSHIRTPAKCAARIGQNFTDTNATVELRPDEVEPLPTVERNGHDFSDGVGTISRELLQRVWKKYGTRRLLKPTALQIRFQGAKGMVSLDPELRGSKLKLRSNMRKYETKATWELEICGAGFKPLPMILNRQFIKIFEDLGIPMGTFLTLQNEAMKHLRDMTRSSINTATFLEEAESARATRMPALIKYLGQIGLDYHQDHFLYSVVEMAVVSKLRDIKYRGRIPVTDGVTLYGIMDESATLKANEIFVITEKAPEGGKNVLVRNQVIVTRSPAMHPGDIQVVNAVDMRHGHPLRELANVVVFSQFGDRDLPSQLSGGDLDGDLYNVIWDPRLTPRTRYVAADYPRVAPKELDRPVTIKDMSDFFVTFMETDQLGMLCTIHQQIADQRDAGTLDPDCIKLAAMASTAVDYSKTGIPANMKECPKYDRLRPDFMAPSPRVVVSEQGYLDFEEDDPIEDDAFEGLDSEPRRMRYYASKKTLGHLYRSIDEHQFLRDIQQQHRTVQSRHKKSDLMVQLLNYMKKMAAEYAVGWDHHKAFAAEIRSSYESSLLDVLYDYEPTPHQPLSEVEAFSGQILGRQGSTKDRQLRELAKVMRHMFEAVVEHTVMRITHGDEAMQAVDDLDDLYDEREFEALPRAIACLDVAVNQLGQEDRRVGELKSFKYIAAGVCLRELDRYRVTTFGSYSGLPKAF